MSEKIALGLHTGNTKLTGEAAYDARLFNQAQGPAFAKEVLGGDEDDGGGVYTDALFSKTAGADGIYRPREDPQAYVDGDAEYKKVVRGANKFMQGDGAPVRDGPVQFDTAPEGQGPGN